MAENLILKDNQWNNDGYKIVEDNNEHDSRLISEEQWNKIKSFRDVRDLKRIVTIPNLNNKKDQENHDFFTRVNNSLYTNNWVGVLSKNVDDENVRIEIHSRFDEADKQYFLLYLISNIYGFNLYDLDINSNAESDFCIIYIILFLNTLKEAYSDGIFKVYVTKKYNDYDFKGTFDVCRHIKTNNPFVGKTAYNVREYSYDNDIICLVLQTLDYIKNYYGPIWDGYVQQNADIREIEDAFMGVAASYRLNVNYAESKICRREITHPMFGKYEEARKLALLILEESGQNVFEAKEDDAFGLLVDASWLWEEFIAVKLLTADSIYKHLLTDASNGSIEWTTNRKWYPDFIQKGAETERRNVVDAKYKFWDWNRADVHQILSYLFLTGGQACGVIYPVIKDSDPDKQVSIEEKVVKPFNGFYSTETEVKFYKLPFVVKQSKNYKTYKDYCKGMDDSVEEWKKRVKDESILKNG